MSFLEDDDPMLYQKAKQHVLIMPDDDDDEPIYCKCGKKAIQKTNMLWFCPEIYHIPDKYFHAG